MCLISKPPSPNIVSPSSSLLFSILSFFFLLVCFTSSCRWAPWPPARTVWTIVIVFSHYFFFFIVNLFKCPHCHLPPSCYAFFFLLANTDKAASHDPMAASPCHALGPVASRIVPLPWRCLFFVALSRCC